MTLDELTKILGRVSTPRYTLPPFSWRVWDSVDGLFMQPRFVAVCDTSKVFGHQTGRKWFVSRHATPDEVVRTAFLAVMTCIEHEIREGFLYEGKAIFGPHISVDALADVADKRSQRPDPPAEVTQ